MKNIFIVCAMLASTCAYAQLQLPDPLTAKDGSKITTVKQWEEVRRPELLNMFATLMYGKQPARSQGQRFEITAKSDTLFGGRATRKDITIYFSDKDTLAMHLQLYTPNNGKAAPIFLSFAGFGRGLLGVPIDTLLSLGYGYAKFSNREVAADGADAFDGGVHKLFYNEGQTKPRPDEWGVLSAWAWGMSRAMDYLETDKDVDASKVAILGTSRLGKAVLWAGASDSRFALTIPNVSGCGGAALMRNKKAEKVADLNRSFPFWTCGNFKAYSNAEETIPFDIHELVALCAPRLVYISNAENDAWVDSEGEWLSAFHAGPVFALYGLKGVSAAERPAVEQPLLEGNVGFHTRKGGHGGPTKYDWNQYLRFVELHGWR